MDEYNNIIASDWVFEYEPIAIRGIYRNTSVDIDDVIIMYMRIFGIRNVRGGSYNNFILTAQQQIVIHYSMINDMMTGVMRFPNIVRLQMGMFGIFFFMNW